MFRLIGRRLAQTAPILLGVSLVVFGLVHLAPGNPIDFLLPADAPPSMVELTKAEFGLDKPLYTQYLIWLTRALRGNLGVSIFSGRSVWEELRVALGNTLLIALPAAVLGFAAGIALGLSAALRRGRLTDRLLSALAIAGVSVPHYWFAIVMVMLFSVFLNVLPAQGIGDAPIATWESVSHLVMPVITLSLIPMGVVARMVRSTALDILSQEFIGALSARGLTRTRIMLHVVRNAAPPVLAVLGLQFGYLLGGSILVENVFNWPGSGNLLNLAIFRRDIPVLQGTVLVLALFFVILNLLVDIAQAAIDPRLRR